MADTTVASCVIDHLTDVDEPGFYYTIELPGEDNPDPVGPFETQDAAEKNFLAAMKMAVEELILKSIGAN